jgi:hypothetical protein
MRLMKKFAKESIGYLVVLLAEHSSNYTALSFERFAKVEKYGFIEMCIE